jgi:hypothetical protein
VREVRRPHGENGQLLHVPRLRNEHRLQLARAIPPLPFERKAD